MALVRHYLRPVSHGVARPPQTHWANNQPWQLKAICESARHQEAHLLPALSHSHWPARPLAWVTAHPACRVMVTGSKGTICCVTEVLQETCSAPETALCINAVPRECSKNVCVWGGQWCVGPVYR